MTFATLEKWIFRPAYFLKLFVTVVQIGLNTIAILGGIVGDDALSPRFKYAV